MNTLVLIEKNNIISEIIKDSLSNVSVKKITNLDDFLKNYSKINPNYLILDESFDEINPLEFCKTIREKYSLLLPILIVLNFYSNIDLEKLKNLGIDFLVKPLNKEEIIKKIQSVFKPVEALSKIKESVVVEKAQISYEDIMDKIKPMVKEEVRAEISYILKQFLEVVEKKDA